MATREYAGHVKNEMKAAGIRLPFVFTPHPVVGVPPEALYRYIEGDDPETGRPVIGEILRALTRSMDETKSGPASSETKKLAPPSAFLKPDTEDNLQRLFYESGWTDGLPVVLPTEERVEKMLTGTHHSPDEAVGETFQRNTKRMVRYSVSNLAVMAVMAGARPEHFPVILAIASTNEPAFMPSTTPFAGMILVNGPIRNQIGMNSGIGAFSPVNLANSVIGRAWTLMSACWGYNRPGRTLWSSQGSGLIYNNMCAAENEEKSVWTPFHVQKGFGADESVVSIFRGWNVLNSLHAAAHRSVGEEINIQLQAIPALKSAATLILDPEVARHLTGERGLSNQAGLQSLGIRKRQNTRGSFLGD